MEKARLWLAVLAGTGVGCETVECREDADCADDEYCDEGPGNCVSLGEVGDACAASDECQPNLVCEGAGSSCNGDDGSGTCEEGCGGDESTAGIPLLSVFAVLGLRARRRSFRRRVVEEAPLERHAAADLADRDPGA